MTEREILADVLVAVTALDRAYLMRTNTGAARDADGRTIRFNHPGTPDITGCVRGRWVGIECKTATGRQSPAQRRFQDAMEAAGGVYILARSARDALAALAVIP